MAPRQKTFMVVPNPLGMQGLQSRESAGPPQRFMTTKQVQAEYRKKNREPRISKADQRRRDREEAEQMRKEMEKDKAANKARMAREKKKELERQKKEEKRKAGLPLVDVRPSQGTISWFARGKKRDRDGEVVVGAEQQQQGAADEEKSRDDEGEDAHDDHDVKEAVEYESPKKRLRTSQDRSGQDEVPLVPGATVIRASTHELLPEPRSRTETTDGTSREHQSEEPVAGSNISTASKCVEVDVPNLPKPMLPTRVLEPEPAEKLPEPPKMPESTASTRLPEIGLGDKAPKLPNLPKSATSARIPVPELVRSFTKPSSVPKPVSPTRDLEPAQSDTMAKPPENIQSVQRAASPHVSTVTTPEATVRSAATGPRPGPPGRSPVVPVVPQRSAAASKHSYLSRNGAAKTPQVSQSIASKPPQQCTPARTLVQPPTRAGTNSASLQNHASRFVAAPRPTPSRPKDRSMPPPAMPPPFREPNVTPGAPAAGRAGRKFLPSGPGGVVSHKESSSTCVAPSAPTSTQLFLLTNVDDILPSPTQEARELQFDSAPKASKTAPPKPKTIIAPPPPRVPASVRPRQLLRQTTHVKAASTNMGPPAIPKKPAPALLATFEPFVPFLSTQDLLLSTQDIREVEKDTDTPCRSASKANGFGPGFRKPLQQISNGNRKPPVFAKSKPPHWGPKEPPKVHHPTKTITNTRPYGNAPPDVTKSATTDRTLSSRNMSQHSSHRSSPVLPPSGPSSGQPGTSQPRSFECSGEKPSQFMAQTPCPDPRHGVIPSSPPLEKDKRPLQPAQPQQMRTTSDSSSHSAETSQSSSASPPKRRFFTSSGTNEMTRLAEERSRRTFREEQRMREMQAHQAQLEERREIDKVQTDELTMRGSDVSIQRGNQQEIATSVRGQEGSPGDENLRLLECLVDDIATDEALLEAGKSFGSICDVPLAANAGRPGISDQHVQRLEPGLLGQYTHRLEPGTSALDRGSSALAVMSQETDYGDFEASQLLRGAGGLF